MNARKILAIVLALLVFIIILQNISVVSFKIFFWQISMSRIIWSLLCVVVGFIAGYALGSIRRRAGK